MVKDETQSVRISKEVVKVIKRHIIEEGGTIRSVIEELVKKKFKIVS
jgi:hypothetical protein